MVVVVVASCDDNLFYYQTYKRRLKNKKTPTGFWVIFGLKKPRVFQHGKGPFDLAQGLRKADDLDRPGAGEPAGFNPLVDPTDVVLD